METLVQMRNNLLEKLSKKNKSELCNLETRSDSGLPKQKDPLHVSRKGKFSRKRSIHGEDFDSVSLSCFLERKRLRKKLKTIGSSTEPSTISDGSKKQNKLCDSLQKLYTVSHCSKKRNKGFRADQSWPSNFKENDSEDLQNGSLKRRQKIKNEKDKVVRDEASQLLRRAQYHLVKLKLEQNLIDAYTGEGWKGQSREKIKPEKEIERAKTQILKCKLRIRDIVRQLDLLGSVGQIDNSLISADGSVHHEHIFCKECKTQEVSEDNDIILCDGTCNCAFHQKCINPPLATEDIPPEDEGWLCKYCDCKMDIIDTLNAHLGTQFSADSTWQDIFKEEALLSDAATREFNPEEWPDDESDDDDYDPDRDENFSASRCNARDLSDSGEQSSSSSSTYSLESEVHWESGFSTESNDIFGDISPLDQNCVTDSADDEIIHGPRQRSAVDYGKLHDEMFGKDTCTSDLFSEDEDWDPRKRRRREKECAAATTLMTLCDSGGIRSDQQAPAKKIFSSDQKARKPPSRVPCDVMQKLRQAFAENELPSKEVKKELSKLVGLEFEKVNKWFRNARYLALKKRKRERSPNCSPSKKFKPDADNTTDATVSNCSSSLLSSKLKLKNVRWNTNLRELLTRQRFKRTSLCQNKANVELGDDMSLKKFISNAENRLRKRRCDTVRSGVQSAETLMERLCHLEAKLWKLKQVVSTIQNSIGDDSNEQSSQVMQVVYVPVAEVREKE